MNWRRSSTCDTGACILVALEPDAVYLKDSKTGVILHLTKAEFRAFIVGAKAGEFDEESHE